MTTNRPADHALAMLVSLIGRVRWYEREGLLNLVALDPYEIGLMEAEARKLMGAREWIALDLNPHTEGSQVRLPR